MISMMLRLVFPPRWGIPNDIYNSVDACKDENHMEQDQKIDASKYVTLARQNYIPDKEHFDVLYDYLSQFEPHVKASKANKAARNHDPLALVANSHAHSLHSHASPSYSRSPQPYYVTHPSSMIDYEDDYQGEIQGDAQEDKLSTAMMLLTRAITQHYSTLTNNRLHTSLNTRNQDVIQDGRVDIQSKNDGFAGNGNRNMLLATKDEAEVHLNEQENDFMLDNAYGDNMLEELNAAVILMARIQPTDEKSNAEPTYDAEVISEVNALQIDPIKRLLSKGVHEHKSHEKLKTVIHTSVDDQIKQLQQLCTIRF
ncbi:hypothetical protein Tco_1012916 [Tanacetum coccineum]